MYKCYKFKVKTQRRRLLQLQNTIMIVLIILQELYLYISTIISSTTSKEVSKLFSTYKKEKLIL